MTHPEDELDEHASMQMLSGVLLAVVFCIGAFAGWLAAQFAAS